MGFFDLFKKKKPVPAAPTVLAAEHKPFGPAVLEIARLISNGDETVLQDISDCTDKPTEWFEAHQERYKERGVDSAEDQNQIQWLGLVDILEKHGWVCERDWKDELEDFLCFIRNLRGFQTLELTIDTSWLNEDGDIPAWCDILTEKWSAQNVRMACIGIDSDSYVLFPAEASQLSTLQALAKDIGQCIEPVGS